MDAEADEFEGVFGASSEGWIIDSGASSHMTQLRQLLVDYEEFDKPQKVCLVDGRTVEAFGRGNVNLTMVFKISDPKKVTMCNALYVPKLACNLFSVRAAITKGKTVKFGNTRCRDRNGRLLGMESFVDKLYRLDCSEAVASGSWIGNKADLWHQRLGHLNEHQLKEMVSQNLAKGVEIPKSTVTEISFCEKCVEGKIPFKSVGEICSTRKLQRVHSDVCRPMPTDSIGGKKCFYFH